MIWMLAAGIICLIGALAALVFVFAQGGAIFVTAQLGIRLTNARHRTAKAVSMVLSYLFWVALTYAGYLLVGGESTLMNGRNFLLLASCTAFVSASIYLFMWTRAGADLETAA